MKRNHSASCCLVILILFFIAVNQAQSQTWAPGAMPIQGRLIDAGGTALNGTYTMIFSLYDAAEGGTALCSDTNSVEVSNGLFNSIVDNCYTDVTGQKLWLGVKVGSDPEMAPRQVLYPVPYALSFPPKADLRGDTSDAILDVRNANSSGRGLRSYVTSTTGENYAVVGGASSTQGYGGYFYNSSGGGTGLYGEGGTGVMAKSNVALGSAVWAQQDNAGLAIYGQNNTTGFLVPTLYLVQQNASGNFIVGAGALAGTRYFRVDRNGTGYFNGGTQNSGADFAEQIPVQGREADYAPGDVLTISTSADKKVELAAEPFSTKVIGVYSTKPAVLGGASDTDEPLAGVPVAIVGIVPCKISTENGPIQRGDLLVTSATPGHAMRADENPPRGSVLGKALQPFNEKTGVIQILVTLQ